VLSLGLSARYNLLRWLAPYARLAGGVGWDKLTLSGGEGSLHDRQFYGQGSAGAGISLRSPGLRFWQSPSAPFLGIMGQIEGAMLWRRAVILPCRPRPRVRRPMPSPQLQLPLDMWGAARPICASRSASRFDPRFACAPSVTV